MTSWCDAGRFLAEEAEARGQHAEVVLGVVDRFARFGDQQIDDRVAILLEKIGVLQDDRLPLGQGHPRPCLEGVLGRGEGLFHGLRIHLGGFGNDLFRLRIDDRKRLLGGDPLAVDQHGE